MDQDQLKSVIQRNIFDRRCENQDVLPYMTDEGNVSIDRRGGEDRRSMPRHAVPPAILKDQ